MNEFPVSLQRCYITWPLEFNVLNFLSRVTQLHFSGRKSHLGSISVLFTTLAVNAHCSKFLSHCFMLISGTSCKTYLSFNLFSFYIFTYFIFEYSVKRNKTKGWLQSISVSYLAVFILGAPDYGVYCTRDSSFMLLLSLKFKHRLKALTLLYNPVFSCG